MKRFFIALSLVLSSAAGMAQQDYQFTHFMFDKLSFNPGYAGMNNAICATGLFREQWAAFDGHPRTGLLNVQAPVMMLRGGLGLTYLYDKLGFEANNIARLSYSYHLGGLGPGTLGIGVSAGVVNKNVNATWKTPDGTPWNLDPSIKNESGKGTVPDINVGLFYQTFDKSMFVGISATHIGQFEMKTLNVQNVHHYWITAGYNYREIQNFELLPSILVKSDGASTQMDLNFRALYKRMIWAGATYRLGDAIAPMIGYQQALSDGGNLMIGYSYGITLSNIANYSNGSHDIMVNYCFSLDTPPKVIKSKNPRFL